MPPFEGFLRKLAADMRFTMFYLFILGVIVIEIIRITIFRKRKINNLYLFLCYGILIAIEVGAIFPLESFDLK